MKLEMIVCFVVVFIFFFGIALSVDENGDNDRPENRGHHRRRRRKRPCGRDNLGKTFFDWSYSYINVNHNYNINCGGPQLGGPLHGGYGPSPIGGFGPHAAINEAQGGNYVEQNGDHYVNNKNTVGSKASFSNLNLLDWLLGIKKTPNEVQNFNAETNQFINKPVHEDVDDTTSDYQNYKPGQYVSAYNPLFGNYVQKVGSFDSSRILTKVTNDLDKILEPLYNLFKR